MLNRTRSVVDLALIDPNVDMRIFVQNAPDHTILEIVKMLTNVGVRTVFIVI